MQAYIDGHGPEQRPLFDRLHRLITDAFPTVDIVLSYKMPTYKVDGRSLHVAAWKHGVSLYGWDGERDWGFLERHPEMMSGKGTLRLRLAKAEMITDHEPPCGDRRRLEGSLAPARAPPPDTTRWMVRDPFPSVHRAALTPGYLPIRMRGRG